MVVQELQLMHQVFKESWKKTAMKYGMYFHLLRVKNVVIFVEAGQEFRDDIREMFRLLDEE